MGAFIRVTKELAPSSIINCDEMAMLIFHTRRPDRVAQVRKAAETLLQKESIILPIVGRTPARLLIDKCDSPGSSKPVIWMDTKLLPIIRELMGEIDFLPMEHFYFINDSQLHKSLRCFGNNAMRHYQRQAIRQILDELHTRPQLLLEDAHGNPDIFPKGEMLLMAKRGSYTGYFFDPRLKNIPELQEVNIVTLAQNLRNMAEKDANPLMPRYPSPLDEDWISAHGISQQLGYAYRNSKARIAIETQLAEHHARGHEGVGLFTSPGKTKGVYRLNPKDIALIDIERLKRDMAASDAIELS